MTAKVQVATVHLESMACGITPSSRPVTTTTQHNCPPSTITTTHHHPSPLIVQRTVVHPKLAPKVHNVRGRHAHLLPWEPHHPGLTATSGKCLGVDLGSDTPPIPPKNPRYALYPLYPLYPPGRARKYLPRRLIGLSSVYTILQVIVAGHLRSNLPSPSRIPRLTGYCWYY